jgi:hypothetical protein
VNQPIQPPSDADSPLASLKMRRSFWASLILVAAIWHVIATRNSWRDIALQTDTGMWAYIGGRILDGALPYRDLWESKPPGIYYTFAAMEALFGRGGDRPFFYLDLVVTLAILALTLRLAMRHARAAVGAGCGFACSVVLCHRVLADWGCNVEKFVALFEVLALGFVLDGAARSRKSKWINAGVCFGLAMMFKQTGAALAVVTILWLLIHRTRRPQFRGEIACLLGGIAIIWAPTLIAIGSAGMWPGFWQQVIVFDFSRALFNRSEQNRLGSIDHWRAVAQTLYLGGVLIVPALLATLNWFRRIQMNAPPPSPTDDHSSGLIVGYFLATLVPVFLAPFGYGHYLLQAAPAAAILLAWILEGAISRKRRWGIALGAILTCVAASSLPDHFVFTLNPQCDFRQAYQMLSTRTYDQVRCISRNTQVSQSVMIWPPDYAVSYYAQRATPLECSNSDVLFKGKPGRLSPPMSALVSRLAANPPDIIVDTIDIFVNDTDTSNPQLLVALPLSLWAVPGSATDSDANRLAAPLKHWIRTHFGGQKRVDEMTMIYRAEPWRSWQDVLINKK